MKKRFLNITLISLIFALMFFTPSGADAQASNPVVRAILFYSPTCPHCGKVIQEDLPPLFEKHGQQLEVIGIDISQPGGQLLYQEAITRFQIPQERLGVPTLIVGDVVLVGSLEIPQSFPGLVEQYLAQGGVGWPDLPGLADALPSPQPTTDVPAAPVAEPAAPQSSTFEPAFPSETETAPPGLIIDEGHDNASWMDKFARDPLGNGLSVLVLAGMFAALVWSAALFNSTDGASTVGPWSWLIPVICLVGLGVAGYLAYVETSNVDAVCGPVGDCNTVQQSEYARLFGVFPIGVLGVGGYLLVLLFWLVAKYGQNGYEHLASLALLAVTAGGTMFSVYLTFLEPFVIGATCAWCLTSAVLMTLLMLLSVKPGKRALILLRK